MDDLRIRIAELALPLLPAGLHPSSQHQKCEALADAILAIPEIAEALEAQAALVRADLVVHEGELHHLIRPDNV